MFVRYEAELFAQLDPQQTPLLSISVKIPYNRAKQKI